MSDPRIERYARLLVDTCVGVQRGWQVFLISTPIARPLVEEIARQIGQRGAYLYQRLDFTGAVGAGSAAWLEAVPTEILEQLPSIERYAIENVDAMIAVSAPENTREASAIPAERMLIANKAYHPFMERPSKATSRGSAVSSRARHSRRTPV
jgi:aminopeptidase